MSLFTECGSVYFFKAYLKIVCRVRRLALTNTISVIFNFSMCVHVLSPAEDTVMQKHLYSTHYLVVISLLALQVQITSHEGSGFNLSDKNKSKTFEKIQYFTQYVNIVLILTVFYLKYKKIAVSSLQ